MRLVPFVALAAVLAGCSTESKPAKPSPTPAAARTPAPVATAVDPSKLPEAWRADASQLPHNFISSLTFIKTMLDEHKSTMEQVTCHCCGKSLAQCYVDTATRAAKACSPL